MKIVTVLGARPQFIKAAPVSRVLRAHGFREFILHTGQHYDENMSDIFFRELEIPQPDCNLGVGSGSHGFQTGQMLIGIEEVLLREKPEWVIVYGDTNSTLAGALAAAKLHYKTVHVEAGLRSFNREMPEEINRVMADHVSSLLFCPSQTAVENLKMEGITKGVHLVGDVMAATLADGSRLADKHSRILERLGVKPGGYLLATVHRAENTDNPERLLNIMAAFDSLKQTVIFPVHLRTRKRLTQIGWTPGPQVRVLEPLGYLDMVMLEKSAHMILTDSGGVQKEAYWLRVPCITLRNETEWVETVGSGWNRLVGTDSEKIVETVNSFILPSRCPPLYGEGAAVDKVVEILARHGE